MALTYQAIATTTVGSGGAANIEFTSIPGTYTDLYILYSLRSNNASVFDNIIFTVNNSTSTYNERLLYGDGSSAASAIPGGGRTSNIQFLYTNGANATSNTFANGSIYIPNYAGSTYKSISFDSVTENNATSAIAALNAGIWSTTSAITSIKLTGNNSTNFVQYSTATLYGIKNTV